MVCEICFCYHQSQGHSDGLHNQNMTVSTVFAELGSFAAYLSLVVDQPECLAKIWDCCVQGQGHSEGSEFQ